MTIKLLSYICGNKPIVMSSEWISPNTITGDAATGTRYLRRDYINEYFWKEVAKGNHILFVAPRRVGKTSVMKDLVADCGEKYVCIYQNIEGVKSRNEFYKRLYELILQCVSNSQKAKSFVTKWVKTYGISEISKSGLKFIDKEIDYESELRNLIPALKEIKLHTVIFLDEFAEVINKLNKQGKQQDAVDILHTLREIRSDDDFRHFTIVFAGSIGLQFVIKGIDRPKLINDLHPVDIGALTNDEALQLIHQLTRDVTIQLSLEINGYLLKKTEHLLPYYIQLMLEEIDLMAREANLPLVDKKMVDDAFNRVLHKNKNFEDWLVRLKDYQADNFAFINEILKHAAHKKQITIQEIYNMASDEKYNHTEDYMDFVDELLNDGYLIEKEKHVYRFISPFLQQFWIKKYPVYHG